jgi:sRNA-binding carbon storage regulator CsrA
MKPGLLLFRKFGERVVVGDSVVVAPEFPVTFFTMDGVVHSLSYILDDNDIENAIIPQGTKDWCWVLGGESFREDSCTLHLVPVKSVGTVGVLDKATMKLSLVKGEEVVIPECFGKKVSFSHNSVMVSMDIMDAHNKPEASTEMYCDVNSTMPILAPNGVKFEVTIESFRGVAGCSIRFNAEQDTSIMREELLTRA